MSRMNRFFILRLGLMLGGCGSGAVGDLALSWSFVDGRRCSESGAAAITVQVGDGATQDFSCAEGLRPAAVTLQGLSADGVTLHVAALSTDEAPLYSATLQLDVLPSEATVTLYADKMR
jgi:hypothetical protein